MPDSLQTDLTSCDREPIHIPGAIQPHGVLIALREPGLEIMAASANLPASTASVGARLGDVLCEHSLAHVAALLSRDELVGASPFPLRFRDDAPGAPPWHALLHRHNGLALLEAEQPTPHAAGEDLPGGMFSVLSSAIERLQASPDPSELWAAATRELRRLSGFDRVKLYRFHADWTGEVVAEDRAEHMPSYLGLNFPASDIPVQARELYRTNPDRIIPDAQYVPVPLVGDPAFTGGPVDLAYAQLRSVSPLHCEYLTNMGVGASMSVSVLRAGQLWGLLACHSREPHRVGPERRQACRLLAQVLSWQLAVAEDAAISKHSAAVRALQARVLEETARGRDHRDAILRYANELLELMDATGFALVTQDAVTLIGRTPNEEEVRELAGWLARRSDAVAFETSRLGLEFAPAMAYQVEASGLLAVPLSRPPRQFMLWFRPEIAQTVTWGGNPEKPVEIAPDGRDRLTPRRSFSAWRQDVRGQSRPWQTHEVVAAGELRDLVLDVLVRRADELERVNSQLARSNEELEAFAYVASHDIREPLRQIETFASLLERAVSLIEAPPEARIGRWVEGIEASSRRLRTLIDDLTEFSRLGRQAQPFMPTSLAEVLAEAESDLAQAIADSEATVTVEGTLPIILCDRGQIRQVMQNLLSNAIKYRDPERPPIIHISARPEPGVGGSVGQPRRMLHVTVTDNGIGFEQRHSLRIFEPFQRLHGADRYPGSGIGLAICRKIVDRHGGVIAATGTPGVGSSLAFTLPLPPAAVP